MINWGMTPSTECSQSDEESPLMNISNSRVLEKADKLKKAVYLESLFDKSRRVFLGLGKKVVQLNRKWGEFKESYEFQSETLLEREEKLREDLEKIREKTENLNSYNEQLQFKISKYEKMNKKILISNEEIHNSNSQFRRYSDQFEYKVAGLIKKNKSIQEEQKHNQSLSSDKLNFVMILKQVDQRISDKRNSVCAIEMKIKHTSNHINNFRQKIQTKRTNIAYRKSELENMHSLLNSRYEEIQVETNNIEKHIMSMYDEIDHLKMYK